MEFISIFNDVLGPVMPGPSSSHTAGSYHIGRLARDLLGAEPRRASFVFDPRGSYARVYRAQSVDLGFAAGLMGWPLTDPRFARALSLARRRGLDLVFRVARRPRADHPNFVALDLLASNGSSLALEARSVGGGAVEVTRVDGWPVSIDGRDNVTLVEMGPKEDALISRLLAEALGGEAGLLRRERASAVLLEAHSPSPLPAPLLETLRSLSRPGQVRTSGPVFWVERGPALFESAAEAVCLSKRRRASLGRLGLAYEAGVLGLTEGQALGEMKHRLEVMEQSAARGFQGKGLRLKLLRPSAAALLRAESAKTLAVGGIHARAAATALAIMHVAGSGGTVCAAPTGGAAGALPAAVLAYAREEGLSAERAALGLFAAGAVGLIVARRATFAAETAGCQVEIGAAGAMAAAAVVDMAGGTAAQAFDAAAISFQNTMGSVCDLVQGLCEIPCHTRNAVAASSAFVCADLVLGGYANPVPLDETIDAVYASGRMLPPELRCTALGGLAVAPSALALGSDGSGVRRRPRSAKP